MTSRSKSISLAVISGLALAGCVESGLSQREVRGKDYATYAFSMYDPGDLSASANQPARPLTAPAKIAVAQLGEVSPPAAMLQRLQKDSAAFALVQSVPGVLDTAPQVDRRERLQDYSSRSGTREHREWMQRYARDVGADYLFIFGGTVDQETTDSPLKLANATIIGAFVVPGEVIQAQARAAGSLIDVNTGRVVMSVSADGHDRRRSASVAVEGDQIKMLESLRDEVTAKLADDLSARVKSQTAPKAG